MKPQTSNVSSAVPAPSGFPEAKVRDKPATLLRASKMWWVTLACLILAIWLTLNSLPRQGPIITIHFPQGHGLKDGDSVRYRGIEVGQVIDVSLNAELSGVDVQVMLAPGEASLNREGTRFWIVRPRLSLTEIQGLETAVGAKYIGVSPGEPSASRTSEFEGLSIAPPDELDHGGLQVVLRSDDRHGISAGAPVTWRGVKAGRVLSVNLSPDARHVHTTVRIDRKYRKLVRRSSKFWVTSGFGVDVGLGGVKLTANSLASILEGGVSFATVVDEPSERPIRDGDVFSLSEKPKKEWFEAEATIPLLDFQLPETVLVNGEYSTSTLGISRIKSFSQNGILVKRKGETVLLTAALPDHDADEPVSNLTITRAGGEPMTVDAASAEAFGDNLSLISASGPASISMSETHAMTQSEDCLLFRSAEVDGKATPIMQTIDLEHIVYKSDRWLVQDGDIDFAEWHGAPVLAVSTGKLIGILTTADGHPVIATPGVL